MDNKDVLRSIKQKILDEVPEEMVEVVEMEPPKKVVRQRHWMVKKYKTPRELQKKVDGYFKERDDGHKPYTVAGIILYLNLHKVEWWELAQGDDEFSEIIKNARLKVESQIEQRLYTQPNVTGSIFSLKNNFGWKDRIENVNVNVNLTDILNKLEGGQDED